VNAFRLPCCDQAICEHCKRFLFLAFLFILLRSNKHFEGQTSLPETCPVCAHTPISSDLCKPNKALRTTLKAFLRTEEKKREKERQSATPATINDATPVQGTPVPRETPTVSDTPEAKPEQGVVKATPTVDAPPEEPPAEAVPSEAITTQVNGIHDNSPETQTQTEVVRTSQKHCYALI
jgi:hypothetical protein